MLISSPVIRDVAACRRRVDSQTDWVMGNRLGDNDAERQLRRPEGDFDLIRFWRS
jgi:hypothetical protein